MSQAYTLSIARVLALFPQVVDAVMRRSDLHLPARQSPTIASYVRAADKKRQSTTQNLARQVAWTCLYGTRLGKKPAMPANTLDQVIVMPSLAAAPPFCKTVYVTALGSSFTTF